MRMPAPMTVLWETWRLAAQMAPYLLVGFGVAGALSLVLTAGLVGRVVGGEGWLASLKAVLVGIPLPLCSCSVIPVTAALRRGGVAPGPAAAFLAATPQTGADSILATHALMGPWFAAFRVLAAFVSGMAAGVAVRWAGGGAGDSVGREAGGCGCCHGGNGGGAGDGARAEAAGPAVWRALRFGFVDLPKDVGVHLIVGLFIGGLLAAMVPPDVLSSIAPPWYVAYGLAMAIGLPLYVCSTGSIPMAAAMIASGFSPGAALVFLITGPATNLATIATSAKMLGARGAAAYVASLALSAWAMGLVVDALPFAPKVVATVHAHGAALTPWHHLSAAALCVMLVVPIVGRLAPKKGSAFE